MMRRARVQGGEAATRLRERRRAQRKRIVIGLGVCALTALALASWHTFTAERRIDGVSVRGAYLTDESSVREAAQGVLDGTTLLIFSNRYSWLVPLSRARRAVEALPSVASATTRVANDDTLELTLVERVPIAIGCAGACALIDERGVAIGDVARATSSLPRIEVSAELERPFDRVVPEWALSTALHFLDSVRAIGYSYDSIVIVDREQFEARGHNLPMLKVAFATERGAAERMKTAFASGMLPADMATIDYIDVRFPRSVAYLPGGMGTNATTTHASNASTTDDR